MCGSCAAATVNRVSTIQIVAPETLAERFQTAGQVGSNPVPVPFTAEELAAFWGVSPAPANARLGTDDAMPDSPSPTFMRAVSVSAKDRIRVGQPTELTADDFDDVEVGEVYQLPELLLVAFFVTDIVMRDGKMVIVAIVRPTSDEGAKGESFTILTGEQLALADPAPVYTPAAVHQIPARYDWVVRPEHTPKLAKIGPRPGTAATPQLAAASGTFHAAAGPGEAGAGEAGAGEAGAGEACAGEACAGEAGAGEAGAGEAGAGEAGAGEAGAGEAGAGEAGAGEAGNGEDGTGEPSSLRRFRATTGCSH